MRLYLWIGTNMPGGDAPLSSFMLRTRSFVRLTGESGLTLIRCSNLHPYWRPACSSI